jgi:hypothetical protein
MCSVHVLHGYKVLTGELENFESVLLHQMKIPLTSATNRN